MCIYAIRDMQFVKRLYELQYYIEGIDKNCNEMY
jgi:hypothetical protein